MICNRGVTNSAGIQHGILRRRGQSPRSMEMSASGIELVQSPAEAVDGRECGSMRVTPVRCPTGPASKAVRHGTVGGFHERRQSDEHERASTPFPARPRQSVTGIDGDCDRQTIRSSPNCTFAEARGYPTWVRAAVFEQEFPRADAAVATTGMYFFEWLPEDPACMKSEPGCTDQVLRMVTASSTAGLSWLFLGWALLLRPHHLPDTAIDRNV